MPSWFNTPQPFNTQPVNTTTPEAAFNTQIAGSRPARALTPELLAAREASGNRIARRDAPPAQPALQAPGNNMTELGYNEQALLHTQNRLLNDPYADAMQSSYQDTQTATGGENYMNQNLGTLDGPGRGDQYWNQVGGQFQNPFAGEQYAREATASFAPQGAASAFNNTAQQNYGNLTGYSGPGNSQSQYGANASSGPNSAQSFFDQYGGGLASNGTYTGENLAAGQYAQTQGAFGDMPIANFDPFYDRASQLGVQNYNRQSAGRGVYGSSEALSGVGNVITDIEAQRANRSFDAEMQRTVEQRMRQQLLGEQARMGDQSGIEAFGANLKGVETYGNLANNAATQTLAQQTMLGNQANDADQVAQAAQTSNIAGTTALGNIASNADTAETSRYNATTGAMNAADQTAISRLQTGADIAFKGDTNARENYTASNNAASTAAGLALERTRLGADIATAGSASDLARLNAVNQNADRAEGSRQGRQQSTIDSGFRQTEQVQKVVGGALARVQEGDQRSFEDWYAAEIAPYVQDADFDQQDKDGLRKDFETAAKVAEAATQPSGKK